MSEEKKESIESLYERYKKGDKQDWLNLKCEYTQVPISEEILRSEGDQYYIAFLFDTNQPVCYAVFKNRYAHSFIPQKRRNYIQSGDTAINAALNIPEKFHALNFDNLVEYEEQRPLITTAQYFCTFGMTPQELARFFNKDVERYTTYTPSKDYSFLTTGPYNGQGKSLTLACITKEEFIRHGLKSIDLFTGALEFLNSSIIFLNEFQLLSALDLLCEKDYGAYSAQQIIRRLSDVDFLALDDIFQVRAKQMREDLADIYMAVIYNRTEIRKQRTAISFNGPKEELNKISSYIYSRMKEGAIYNCLFNKDYRGVKQ